MAFSASQTAAAAASSPSPERRYAFDHGEAGWEATRFVKPSNALAEDLFGITVALTEEGFVVGALRGDARAEGASSSSASSKDSGSDYVFR